MKLGTLSVSYEETAIVSLNDSSLTQEFVSTVSILLEEFQQFWLASLILTRIFLFLSHEIFFHNSLLVTRNSYLTSDYITNIPYKTICLWI